MIFILSIFSSGLEFWLVNHTSICKTSESNVSKTIKFSGKIFDNWPNDLWGTDGTDVFKTLEFCW